MSRVANNPVIIPDKVDVTLNATEISVKGPLGALSHKLSGNVQVARVENRLEFKGNDNSIQANAMSGTFRALVSNMVTGVSKGFEKKLALVGVGYRAQAQGDKLNLTLGFSHPVVHQMPKGIKVETPSQTEIVIKGIDKQLVGQVAADWMTPNMVLRCWFTCPRPRQVGHSDCLDPGSPPVPLQLPQVTAFTMSISWSTPSPNRTGIERIVPSGGTVLPIWGTLSIARARI